MIFLITIKLVRPQEQDGRCCTGIFSLLWKLAVFATKIFSVWELTGLLPHKDNRGCKNSQLPKQHAYPKDFHVALLNFLKGTHMIFLITIKLVRPQEQDGRCCTGIFSLLWKLAAFATKIFSVWELTGLLPHIDNRGCKNSQLPKQHAYPKDFYVAL